MTNDEINDQTKKVFRKGGVKVEVTVTKGQKGKALDEFRKESAKPVPVLIAQGLWNMVFKNDLVEEVAALRMDICKGCPLLKYEVDERPAHAGTYPRCNKFGPLLVHAETGEMVNGCGCWLDLKTRATDASCPAGKWHAVDLEKYARERDKPKPDGESPA